MRVVIGILISFRRHMTSFAVFRTNSPMENPPKNAANFVRQLAEMTYRLATKDIVVASLHADWSNFGSWELQLQKGKDAVQYVWVLPATTMRESLKWFSNLGRASGGA
jgi:hypothetical protein